MDRARPYRLMSFPAGAKRRGRESSPFLLQVVWIPFPALRAAGDDTIPRLRRAGDAGDAGDDSVA